MTEKALAIRTQLKERAIQLVGELGIKNLKIPPQKVSQMLQKYGEEVTTTFLMIKWEEINPSIHSVNKLLKQGFSFEQVITFYLTRETIKESSQDHKRSGVSLVQLARLAERFPDFKEMETDEQIEIIESIIKMFDWKSSFRDVISMIIERADDLGISDIYEFMQIISDFNDGDIHETYFPNREND